MASRTALPAESAECFSRRLAARTVNCPYILGFCMGMDLYVEHTERFERSEHFTLRSFLVFVCKTPPL